jgi:N-acetylmuramoyl-L-alanine amidase
MHIFLTAGRRALTVLTLAAVVALPGTALPQQHVKYVSARQVAHECRMSVFFEELSNRLRLEEEDTQVVVTPGLDLAIFDGETVKLEARVKLARGEVQIPDSFAAMLKERLQQKRDERRKREKVAQAQGKKLTKVVIDPGHGGRFPGACAHGLQEKEINLDVSKMVKELLEEQGIEVLMTRTRDVHLSEYLSRDLDLRCDFSNSKKADIFVSIHANAGPPSATGFEVYVVRPRRELDDRVEKATREAPITGEELGGQVKRAGEIDRIVWRTLLKEYYDQSRCLAGKIIEELDEAITDKNRGVLESNFRVIKNTRCPAVLVEMGFMSNRATAAKLATKAYRKRIAGGIAGGILEFKKEYDATCGFTRPGGEGVSE